MLIPELETGGGDDTRPTILSEVANTRKNGRFIATLFSIFVF